MKYPEEIIETAYNSILQSEVFHLDGPPIDLPAALTELGNAVHASDDFDESIWSSLGEHTEAPLGDLIVGAYWALSEWHEGQASPEYAALCSLGQVFSPGMTNGPEPESGEACAYELIGQWFQDRADKRAGR